MKAKFASNDVYLIYSIFLLIRPIIVGIVSLYYVVVITKKSYKENKKKKDLQGIKLTIAEGDFLWYKSLFYLIAHPIIMYTGAARLLRHQKFLVSLSVFLIIEILA